jgi:Sulfotransferase family
MHNKVKVLFIAGTGRNGSTLLGDVLGQANGFTNVGELLDLGWNLGPGRPTCGCGAALPECDQWAAVLKEAFGGMDQSFVAHMLRLRFEESFRANIIKLATSSGTRELHQRLARNIEELERLFRAIQKLFKSAVIVDSSKQPLYLHLLQSIDAIDLYVVHLVRDPRALAYAFLHRLVREGYVLHMTPLQTSAYWLRRNLAVELLTRPQRRLLRIRYEDLVANPRQTILKIVDFTGETFSDSLFDNENAVMLCPLHTVAGNPNRFITGRVQIRGNEEWTLHMKRRHRTIVTAATWPLLIKYGYPIRTLDSEYRKMSQRYRGVLSCHETRSAPKIMDPN